MNYEINIVVPKRIPTLIKQRYKGDCAVASLAMFLGISYDEIIKHYSEELEVMFENGVWDHKTFEVAEKYGVELTCVYKDFDFSKPSMLIIPSFNLKDKNHMVFWDGEKVFDPSPAIVYKSKPENILYIFQRYKEL
ncbi:MAG: hypothetical protein PVH88_01940 [Ignavibacteria bacterium]|jgi:hypothetical protein